MAVRQIVYLVRHARATRREGWTRPDRLRPLSTAGDDQAAALARSLRAARVDRLVSSPAVRCVETFRPFAAARELRIRRDQALAEGASAAGALRLIRRLRGRPALCSHGDVIEKILERLRANGVRLRGGVRLPKGCIWVLELDEDGDVVAASYRPPPPD